MKSLPRFAIENSQFSIMIFVVLVVLGMNSYMNMPRTQDPPIAAPGAVVTVAYPGASPKDLEELVVKPLEESINELEKIDEIKSNINDGFAIINVTFDYGNYDFDDKYDEVVQQVNTIKVDLPDGIKDISFRKKTTTDTKILQIALTSDDAEYEALDDEAEDLKKDLEEVGGIKKVEIAAVPARQVKVAMDIDNMVNMGITIDAIENAINSNNQNIPGGDINIGKRNFNIKTSGSFNDLNEIRNIAVGSAEGKLVYLKNVAAVDFDYEENNYRADFNGKRCIFITAEQKEDLNVLDIMEEAQVKIDKFQKNLPRNIELEFVHNQAKNVDASINGFIGNLIQGVILVGLCIMLSIGFKPSLVSIMAIPTSIIIGLYFIDLFGYGLQNISIAALVIALGLLVDNSIVVIENTERHLHMGYDIREAAIRGTSQVAYAITSSTLTTLAAFIPIVLLKDAAGDYMSSMPVTVTATLAASLAIALMISPMMMTKLIKLKPGERPKEQPLQKRLKKFISGPYKKFLIYCLNHSKRIIIIAVSAFLLAGFLFYEFIGTSFFDKAEIPQFLVEIKLPQGSNLNETERVTKYVESVLDTVEGIDHYAGNTGHSNPKIYFNHFTKEYAKDYGEIFVMLKENDKDVFDEVVGKLRNTFDSYKGAEITVKEFETGIPVQNPIEVILYGDDLLKLVNISADFEKIAGDIPGIVNVDNELGKIRTDFYVNINKEKAALLGVAISEIDKSVRTAMNGSVVSQYRNSDGDEYDIVLRLPAKDKAVFSDFNKIYVKSMSGVQIPLSQLASVEFKEGPSIITHYNLRRSATIGADVMKGYNTNEVTNKLAEQLKNYDLPSGFSYKMNGSQQKQNKAFGNLGVTAIVAALVILAILVLQFRSFVQPFIIFLSLPLALIGSVLALLIMDFTFSFTAFIGAVALIGIVINDAIVLIDFTNEMRREGESVFESLVEAAQIRFTPILITSITTIGGLLPLTLQGGSFWGPFGWTVIGGLTFSTTLTLIVIPVIYKVMIKDMPAALGNN